MEFQEKILLKDLLTFNRAVKYMTLIKKKKLPFHPITKFFYVDIGHDQNEENRHKTEISL